MKYYITKHALTQGILEVDGDVSPSGKYVRYKNGYLLYAIGKDAFLSIDEARQRVRLQAASKVASLERKLAKIRPIAKGADVQIKRHDD